MEVTVSVALLTFLMLMLAQMTDTTSRVWRQGASRVEAYQSARASLEGLGRELAPALVDSRMQFAVGPGDLLTTAGAHNVAPGSPAVLWMAPLGTEGSLRCVGYYLYRDDSLKFYRLKRIFIGPTDSSGSPSPFYPQMVDLTNPSDPSVEPTPTDASWFTRAWNANAFNEEDPANTEAVVSSFADGVIAFWVQPLDTLDNPIPAVCNSSIHPPSALYFNSAAYFESATSTAFDNGQSFTYLAKTGQSLKANRTPAAIAITVVVIDSATLARGVSIPQQGNLYDANGALNVTASVQAFTDALQQNKIFNARTFCTRIKLVNGS